MTKAMHDILVVYGQNGEALRPEQGYPLRLIVPGWEGNANAKWLRRLNVTDQPDMTRIEAPITPTLMPDGTARQFTVRLEAKSVITFPSGGQKLPGPGFYEVTGLAWSGRGTFAASRSRPTAGDVAPGESAGARPPLRPHEVPVPLALGRARVLAPVSVHRRDGLHSAHDGRARQGAGSQLEVLQQRHPDLEGDG